MASTIPALKHLQIPLKEVLKATNDFDEKSVIGKGGFGKVYRGQLLLSGEMVNIAARRLDPELKWGGFEFLTEITALSSLKHENIVSLIGFCEENGEKIIINKREATKGSLSMHLSKPTLTWIQRLNICVGVARALKYIHNGEGRGSGVIHRNINSYTVLLDNNLEAKLSGFEFSLKQSVNEDRVVFSQAIGAKGYMDPEIVKTGGVTHKSDIYSFGVVLCGILCGREAFNNEFLAPLFISYYENGSLNDIILPDLRSQMNRQSLRRFSKAADSCLKENRTQRSKMNDILIELEKALELEILLKKLEHLKIPLIDISLATENFSEAYHVRKTDYYEIYTAKLEHFDEENSSFKGGKNNGELPRRHNTVVIYRFLPSEDETVEEMFYTEIKMLDTCKHPSIVKLLGFSDEGSEMILVIEHISNGYLDDYWKNLNGDMPILTWEKRLKICLDVAKALNYLHTGMEDEKMILHRDIKSNYIALDGNLGAKLIDFGVSVLLPLNQDDEARDYLSGTEFYWDPEYTETGKFKRESDVYSFGVVLFEVLCGRLAGVSIYSKESDQEENDQQESDQEENDQQESDQEESDQEESDQEESDHGLVFEARQCFQDGTLLEMIDPILKEESDENGFILKRGPNKYSLKKFVKIAHSCIAETHDQRPTMKMVIQELQDALFIQMEQLDMVHVADEIEELKLTRENSEEETQCPDIVQDVDEVEKSMELKLRNVNSLKNIEHLKIRSSDIMLATSKFSKAYNKRNTEYYKSYTAELKHFDEENPSIKEGKNKGEVPRRRNSSVVINRFPSERKEMFYTEIKMLATCKHPNIVKLLGFCDEGSKKILVVEHLSKGYLYDYLWYIEMPILTWASRLKICLDVAKALNYLHNEMEGQQSVVHRNIKSGNIALDKNLGAKIVDFGYSVFQPLYDENVWETDVHMDPEYKETHTLTRESDIYSFGVVLFEVLCGKVADDEIYTEESKEGGLAFVARRCFREGTLMEMIDPKLKEESDENSYILKRGPNKDSLGKVIKIALHCVAETQDQRPTMKVVVKELQDALFYQENNDRLIISLHDIKVATGNFDDKNEIGGGGFGKVYKGKGHQGDTIVAKRLDTTHGQGEKEFRTELQILFEYKHENIISLVGFCNEKDEKVIVYEYASQGSLDGYLKDDHLTWMMRLNICIDVATALAFLHGGAGKQAIVIHRDIKTPNILLNDKWKAKLADFGLSLISPINQETDYVIDHACGTTGYLDPLYSESGFLTKESDIYSFGVVLFEIMCGEFLTGVVVKESIEKGKHDDLVFEALKEQIEPKALTAFQTIAYQCLHDDRENRPTAKEVLRQLKEAREFQISGSD